MRPARRLLPEHHQLWCQIEIHQGIEVGVRLIVHESVYMVYILNAGGLFCAIEHNVLEFNLTAGRTTKHEQTD